MCFGEVGGEFKDVVWVCNPWEAQETLQQCLTRKVRRCWRLEMGGTMDGLCKEENRCHNGVLIRSVLLDAEIRVSAVTEFIRSVKSTPSGVRMFRTEKSA